MKSIELDNEYINNYFKFLKNLSPPAKLELIEKLTRALKKDISGHKNQMKESFGAWESDKSADEIIDEIYKSRNFTHRLERL
jgi:hypothetical protein